MINYLTNKMDIQKIKDKYTCLDYLGGRVVKKVANGYLARAPWREDSNPSLTITPNGRGWHDMATGAHGSVIDLVMLHLGCDLHRACEELEANPSFSLPQSFLNSCGGKEKDSRLTRFDIMPITSRGLYAYLHQRCVSMEIAKQFLMEARYSFREGDSYLYALAYQNDKGGYELRNPTTKRSEAPKGITTHIGRENAPVVVFEGFFDMLSFATLCGGVKHNYVVLNSTVNKEAVLDTLKTYQNKVYLALDNDMGGDDTTAWLVQHLPSAIDIRDRFAPAKDVNEYLIKLKHERYGKANG